jgi:tetratricopeptide (TPR) repeat protein
MTFMEYKALCFVDMPFGTKHDLASGTEIDFDHIYSTAIKPAIEQAGLKPLRGDEERTGGVIHTAMFARLLLSEYVVADLTLANPNVFYELGIRHAARPFTTVPIFANVHPLPFDVAMIRAIIYQLDNGRLSEQSANTLKSELRKRLEEAMKGPATSDSPLFQLIPEFPVIDLPHEVTDAFQERVKHEKTFHEMLSQAKSRPSNAERCAALLHVQHDLGDLKKVQRNVLVDLMLSFRSVEAWNEMVELIDAFPDYLKDVVLVRQQWALALNRRNTSGDRDKAIQLLEGLIQKHGSDPETLGILGRVHKDRYREAEDLTSYQAIGALDEAIKAYTKGFESDPRDYYPGVNAITLLHEKGDAESLKEAQRLKPLVNFAVARRGGVSSNNYWDLATALELACLDNDWIAANHVLLRAQYMAKESWMLETTMDNLIMIQQAKDRQGRRAPELDEIIESLQQHVIEI